MSQTLCLKLLRHEVWGLMGTVLAHYLSSTLKQVQETIENSTAVCSIWHVNVELLPEWILTSVHQVSASSF